MYKDERGFLSIGALVLLLIVIFSTISLVQSYYHLSSFYDQQSIYYERAIQTVLQKKGELQ